ncbi:hypothetical protein JTZ10_16245 [Gordonia rubripertincta]|uniref:DUF222 domain-containing protein n=1 Tax=Gordonia rubripertincta TaxID=36822 RepID=A0AAW4G8V5_GORRU|nr:hypothetical protein [Gordonia rubripertincta]MBM7279301.1 hypothetical protein [Gordonia rubripertincta]
MAIANTDRYDYDLSMLEAVDKLSDSLVNLGVLTAKNAAKAHAAVRRARHAQTLSTQYSQHVETAAISAGDQLFDTDELDLSSVLEIISLPSTEHVDAVLDRVWLRNAAEARTHAFGNIGSAPARLTERFDELSDEVLAIAAELGDITTPQQALDADKAPEWQRLMALRDEYNALADLRTHLRSFGLIAAPAGYNTGWHWNYRHETEVGAAKLAQERKTTDEGRALLIWVAKQRPYCPAASAEAKATLEAARTSVEDVRA